MEAMMGARFHGLECVAWRWRYITEMRMPVTWNGIHSSQSLKPNKIKFLGGNKKKYIHAQRTHYSFIMLIPRDHHVARCRNATCLSLLRMYLFWRAHLWSKKVLALRWILDWYEHVWLASHNGIRLPSRRWKNERLNDEEQQAKEQKKYVCTYYKGRNYKDGNKGLSVCSSCSWGTGSAKNGQGPAFLL